MSGPLDRVSVTRDTAVGVVVYVAVLTAAYYYNLTFVQLGLTEIGQEQLGLSMESVAAAMGLLAVTTLCVTLASGWLMDRRGWGTTVRVKFRVLFAALLLQLVVTFALAGSTTFGQFVLGILACAMLLGTAIPFAFSLMLDLVPPGLRGYAAGAVAACAFFLAALFPLEWTVGSFTPAAVAVLAPVIAVLGVLSVAPTVAGGADWTRRRTGRLADGSTGLPTMAGPVGVGLVLLFGAFFVDSLGFVRIIETPAYVDASWQSSAYSTRLTIAGTHVVGGLVAGVAYTKLRYLWLFVATFVLFALAQFLYVYDIAVGGPGILGMLMPLVYVLAVSCYTTITFALWPDLATPETVGRYTGIGVGIGGWLATFASTALALVSDRMALALEVHLLVVGVLSVVFLSLTVSLWYLTAESDSGSRHSLGA